MEEVTFLKFKYKNECCCHLNIQMEWIYCGIMHLNDRDGLIHLAKKINPKSFYFRPCKYT